MSNKSILVVAAHPDDEVLGCGATIARHALRGDRVSVLFMTDGVSARGKNIDSEDLNQRRTAAFEACQLLGASPPQFLSFDDNRMDHHDLLDVVQALEIAIKGMNVDIIYTHIRTDLNIDHQLTAQAVLTAFRPLPESPVSAIYGFEVPSSTEWSVKKSEYAPQVFVNTSDTHHLKLRALECYECEMRPFPHPRSVEAVSALANWRGANAGFVSAEAFWVYRQRFR